MYLENKYLSYYTSFPCGSAGKESACSAEDLGLIPGLGRSPGEGKGYPVQYSGLENSMDYTVHAVARVEHNLATKEKEMGLDAMVLVFEC